MNVLQTFGWTPEQYESMDRTWQLYAMSYVWRLEKEAKSGNAK